MSDRVGLTFSQIQQNFKPNTFLGLGGDQHLRSGIVEMPDGSQAQRIYTHKGISGSGDKAMQERMTKWADGAAFVKQSLDREYGPGVGALVFQKIIDDGGPDLSREVRRRDLKTIQATIDELSGGNIALMGRFAERGLTDVGSAQTLAVNMYTAVNQMSEQDTDTINQSLLGGGNYALRALFDRPDILDIEDEEQRVAAFEELFDSHAEPGLEFQNQQVDRNARDPGHAYFGEPREVLDTVKQGQRLAVGVTKEHAANFLRKPENVDKAREFLQRAKGLGLGFEDTMAVIRSRGNIRSVPPNDIQAAIQKLYAREELSEDEVHMINYLFPGASS